MANEFDYEYKRGRRDREYYDQPYYRDDEERYYRGSRAEASRYGAGQSGYYGEPYRGRRSSRNYSDPYESYESSRFEESEGYREPYYQRSYEGGYREPYYQRSYEGGYREPYYRGRYGRGGEERGFFERAGDEVRSWFGDEEADRRRRVDEMRRGRYAGRGPRGYQRSDERIREDINDRLTDDWYIDAGDIEVSVNKGMVTLTGRVDSRDERRRAEDIVESVSGVTDVSDQLRVSRSVQPTTEAEGTRARSART